MHTKITPLASDLSRQYIVIVMIFLMAIVWVFKVTAQETSAAEKNNAVSEAFKYPGEYVNPNGDGYPTAVKVEYVMGCLAANGMDLGNLVKCSCSIDYIAAQLSFEKYTQADTVLRAQLDQGTKGAVFRESGWAKDMVNELQEIQSASSLECF
ncbi:hypothetical protein [Candidatus Spongiihabitans sp.]|uniref:hypothetical protein n=1 Tax=Candidatus Spongiihabitans sp. TaxID=3101308 RepID=UPI003C6F8282